MKRRSYLLVLCLAFGSPRLYAAEIVRFPGAERTNSYVTLWGKYSSATPASMDIISAAVKEERVPDLNVNDLNHMAPLAYFASQPDQVGDIQAKVRSALDKVRKEFGEWRREIIEKAQFLRAQAVAQLDAGNIVAAKAAIDELKGYDAEIERVKRRYPAAYYTDQDDPGAAKKDFELVHNYAEFLTKALMDRLESDGAPVLSPTDMPVDPGASNFARQLRARVRAPIMRRWYGPQRESRNDDGAPSAPSVPAPTLSPEITFVESFRDSLLQTLAGWKVNMNSTSIQVLSKKEFPGNFPIAFQGTELVFSQPADGEYSLKKNTFRFREEPTRWELVADRDGYSFYEFDSNSNSWKIESHGVDKAEVLDFFKLLSNILKSLPETAKSSGDPLQRIVKVQALEESLDEPLALWESAMAQSLEATVIEPGPQVREAVVNRGGRTYKFVDDVAEDIFFKHSLEPTDPEGWLLKYQRYYLAALCDLGYRNKEVALNVRFSDFVLTDRVGKFFEGLRSQVFP